MNALIHVAATLALLWLSLFCFQQIGETALGVAAFGAFLAYLVLTIMAAFDDIAIMQGKKPRGDE